MSITPTQPSREIALCLIDDDPVFRLGLAAALEPFSDLRVTQQGDRASVALERLARVSDEGLPDVILLELGIATPSSEDVSGLDLCRQLRQIYPDIPILLLSKVTEVQPLRSAQALGVRGYLRKGVAIDELVTAIRRVAVGETYWQAITPTLQSEEGQLSPLGSATPPRWVYRQRETGLRQIEENLAKVEAKLANRDLSTFDWIFWNGLRRELQASRWLIEQLLPVEVVVVEELPPSADSEEEAAPLVPLPNRRRESDRPDLAGSLFDRTLGKIQGGVENLTDIPLEIDVLQPDKKRELLYIVIEQLRDTLAELRFLQLSLQQLRERRSLILREIWQGAMITFFSKYYAPLSRPPEYQVVDLIIREDPLVETAILKPIPLVNELLAFLLFEEPIAIANVPYRANSPEARDRAEAILQNLMLQVANGVMQVILNRFGEAEELKTRLFQQRYFSIRELSRFRNELTWRYRTERLYEEPRAIFESRYRLLVLRGSSIRRISIYAPRQSELNQLTGIPWAVTIALEFRDASAPRLQTVISFLGGFVVYLLTRVIGRGIGLIGRGIIQGIGNALQDSRYGKNSERGE